YSTSPRAGRPPPALHGPLPLWAAAIRAEEAGVPLVAYDRLIDDRRVDWYVGFDNDAVGRLQARFLAGAVAGRPGAVVMLNGAARSEEHTFELQSPYDLVCRLLL